MTDLIGTRLGDFEIVRELGRGGMGQTATRAFVLSFIAVLVLDFFLAILLNNLYHYLWPQAGHLF